MDHQHPDMRHDMSPHEHAGSYHHKVHTLSDSIAFGSVRFARFFADLFFGPRYGHRAVVLETIAAVPGMVGGLLQHLRALRLLRDDRGWIKPLLDEAENERMHLMVYSQIACPTVIERWLIMFAQFIFYNVYFLLYLISPRTAHRAVGYLEEEAVKSYTEYLLVIEKYPYMNIAAPQLAIEYWGLKEDARLSDVIRATRLDEMYHRDVNHTYADRLNH